MGRGRRGRGSETGKVRDRDRQTVKDGEERGKRREIVKRQIHL